MRCATLVALVILLAPSAEGRTTKGDGPRTFVVAYGSVWVGFGDGRVVRVDPETGRTREILRRGDAHVYWMAAGFGSVWLTSSRAATGAPRLLRVDPRSGRVHSFRVAKWGTFFAVGAGGVWVTDEERSMIVRLDARTGRITGRVRLPGKQWGVPAAGEGGVWLQTVGPGDSMGPSGPRVAWLLDSSTLRARRAFKRSCDMSLLPSGRQVWVLDHCDGTLARFDPATNTWTEPIRTGRWATSVTSGFASIWVSDGGIVGGRTVYRVDPRRRVVTARIRAEAAHLAPGENVLWILDVADATTGWLRRIDPATNRVVGRPIRLSARQ